MSKDKILAAIRKNKPTEVPLPEPPSFPGRESSPVEAFASMVEAGGGKAVRAAGPEELNTTIKRLFPKAEKVASPLPEVRPTIELDHISSPAELETIDVAVISGQLGVAENGAIWTTEEDCGHRVLPFITQHLVIVLNPGKIVDNMHQAYEHIQIDATGFGLFIAGPSKTADIEQSLVIGAQGARSMTVILKE